MKIWGKGGFIMDKIPDMSSLDFLKNPTQTSLDGTSSITNIPIPSPEFLRHEYAIKKSPDSTLIKHERAYEAFCRWSSLPKELRKPKTAKSFEEKWSLPRSYTEKFTQREDFRNKRLTYFWDWMMDNFPDVVYSMYKRAVSGGKSSAADAKAFAELISKHLDIERPQTLIQPIALIGVPQEKIEKLFIPKGYEKTEGIIPGEVVK